jgi:hypothetical protein
VVAGSQGEDTPSDPESSGGDEEVVDEDAEFQLICFYRKGLQN